MYILSRHYEAVHKSNLVTINNLHFFLHGNILKVETGSGGRQAEYLPSQVEKVSTLAT